MLTYNTILNKLRTKVSETIREKKRKEKKKKAVPVTAVEFPFFSLCIHSWKDSKCEPLPTRKELTHDKHHTIIHSTSLPSQPLHRTVVV